MWTSCVLLHVCWICSCYLLTFEVVVAQWQVIEDNSCRTPNNEPGICIDLRQCPSIFALIRDSPRPLPQSVINQLQKSQCGYVGSYPKVCCPKNTPAQTTQQIPVYNQNEQPPDVSRHPNLRLLKGNCGFLTIDRIIHGNKTSLFEFPWMALLAYNTNEGRAFRCGGTLINERYVLTAAHCISNLPASLKLVSVRLGEHNVLNPIDCEILDDGTEDCAPAPQDIDVDRAIPHPRYSSKTLQNDIGLIRLRTRADVSVDSVSPICLPVGNLRLTNFEEGKNLIAAGWGATEKGTNSPDLLKVELPVVGNRQCASVYNRSTTITHKQMCAGGVGGKDSCAGDSGGPLKTSGNYNGDARYVQFGIVSFGPRLCGTQGLPGVYTRVAHFMDFILDNMRP